MIIFLWVSIAFSQVAGIVKDVKGQRITLNIGASDGVKIGDTYEVYEEAMQIHPATGRIIKGEEKLVCKIGIVEVAPNESIATIKECEPGREISAGDRVRSSGKAHPIPPQTPQPSGPSPIAPAPALGITGEGNIYINSEPTGAVIIIDKKPYPGATPILIEHLKAGEHTLSVRKETLGIDTTITVTPNELQKFSYKLEPLKGELTIVSDPFEATVFLDDENKGMTPLNLKGVSTGAHKLKIQKEGYADIETRIQLKPDVLAKFTIKLKEGGTLSVMTEIPDARVRIDNKDEGPTPFKKNIGVGRHRLSILKPGYESIEEIIDLKPRELKEIMVSLKPILSLLSIVSDPQDAGVYIEGKEIGTAPLDAYKIQVGQYKLELKHKDYKTYAADINISEKKHLSLRVKLVPLPGAINVDTEPSGALIILDGEQRGQSPLVITDLEVGRHKIEILKDDYKRITKNIAINPNLMYRISERLEFSEKYLYEESLKKRKVYRYTTASLAGVSFIVFGIFQGAASAAAEKYNSAVRDYKNYSQSDVTLDQKIVDGYRDTANKAKSDYESYTTGGYIALGTGAALSALSAYLFLTKPAMKPEMSSVDQPALSIVPDIRGRETRVLVNYRF